MTGKEFLEEVLDGIANETELDYLQWYIDNPRRVYLLEGNFDYNWNNILSRYLRIRGKQLSEHGSHWGFNGLKPDGEALAKVPENGSGMHIAA